MAILLISDPHGFYSKVREKIDSIMTEDDRLAVLGDMLDRGQEAKAMCEYLVDLLSRGKLILIRGNHEDLFLDCLYEIEHGRIVSVASASHHLSNGTYDTMLQLAEMTESEALRNPAELVRRVKESDFYNILLPACVDYYETKDHILTHGWIPAITHGYGQGARYHYDPDWREASAEDWRRARWSNGMAMAHDYGIIEPGKTIVAGHFHTSYAHARIEGKCPEYGPGADFSPYIANGIIAIDGCISYSGVVNCVVIDDD